MFIMSTSTYPPDKAVKVGKKFFEARAKPLPPFIKRLYTLSNSRLNVGIKVIGIYEVDDSKLKEGTMELGKYLNQFNEIEGYRWEFELMISPEEAMAIGGIKP
jgi:hypothetical protein